MDRITAIQRSLGAFVCGVLAVLPVIGLIPAICALTISITVRRRYHDWNPAATYLRWAMLLGLFGLLNSALAAVVILYVIANPVLTRC